MAGALFISKIPVPRIMSFGMRIAPDAIQNQNSGSGGGWSGQ